MRARFDWRLTVGKAISLSRMSRVRIVPCPVKAVPHAEMRHLLQSGSCTADCAVCRTSEVARHAIARCDGGVESARDIGFHFRLPALPQFGKLADRVMIGPVDAQVR